MNTQKTIISVLFSLSLTGVFSQVRTNQSVSNKAHTETSQYEKNKDFALLKKLQKEDVEPMFSSNVVPTVWKNESVIILARKLKVEAFTENGTSKMNVYLHAKLKLNDMAAVESNSEYNFDDGDLVELKVVKANGKEEKVNLDDAVEEKIETNNKFLNLFLTVKKKKVSIKNLEVGDIIDFSSVSSGYRFQYAVDQFLNFRNPVVSNKCIFSLEKNKFAFAFKAMNGAPGYDLTNEKNKQVYSVSDTMREKERDELFTYSRRVNPFIKVNIIYVRDSRVTAEYAFFIDDKKVKTGVDEKDLKKYVTKVMTDASGSYSDFYLDFIKEYGYELSDEDYVSKYFYYCRDQYYSGDLAFKSKFESPGVYLIKKMVRHLNKRNIPYEIVLLVSKETGSFNDILFSDEISWGIKMKPSGKELTVFAFSPFSHLNDYDDEFEGTEAYSFSPAKTSEKFKMEKFKMPVSKPEENKFLMNVHASFNSTNDTLSLIQDVEISGQYKAHNTNDIINHSDYFLTYIQMLEQKKEYSEKDPLYFFIPSQTYFAPTKDFIDSEEKRKREQFKTEQEQYRKDRFKRKKKEDYIVYSFDKFELKNDSRDSKDPKIKYHEEFKIGEILHKVGTNYVLDAGEIFGSLYEINLTKNREKRDYPIFIDYNKNYVVNLTVDLPPGTKAGDISILNKTYDSEVGYFKTTARVEGNTLVMNMEKTYKAFVHDAGKWKDFLKFTDTGADFINSKIILTP
ncbi:MAG: hypothetical protein ACHQK8_04650 [Bacteroidia bacterium]